MSKSKILFLLSGSIACYKACAVISKLVQEGCQVQTAATAGALQFIGAATLEGLTGKPVFSDVFEHGRMMDHIEISKWADAAILCPASAKTINALASGTADGAIGSLFLAFDLKRPFLIAPAMNQQMLRHPVTQQSLEKLLSFGVTILPTEEGHQACGDVGQGRLLEPERIVSEIHRALERRF